MKRLFCVAALLAALVTGGHAEASSLQIQFDGLNLEYDGAAIFDAESISGGGGDPSLADPLITMNFLVDGSVVKTLTTDIRADVFIGGVAGIPAGGGQITTAGQGDTFGFDLLTKSTTPGWGVALNLDEVTIGYTGSSIAIFGGATASSVPTQMLPDGLEFDETKPITVSFSSANLTDVTDAGGFLTGFKAAGTGDISGTLVPEPTSAALLLGGFAFAAVGVRRRKNRS